MDDLLGRHPGQFVIGPTALLRRMLLMHPIRDALADGVEFDAGNDVVAVGCFLVHADRAEIGLQHLKLNRYRQAVFGPALTDADEDLSGFLACLESDDQGQ
jgi:hypothetical protein